MTGTTDRPAGDAGTPSPSAQAAASDLMFVLGTLFAVKWALLQFDQLWTYAGPISLVASVFVASWRLMRNHESWADLGLRKPVSLSRTLGWSLLALIVTIAAGIAIEAAITAAGVAGNEIDPRFSQRFVNLPGNTPVFVYWVVVSWVVGGFVEEMLFRGMLISRLERLLSGGGLAVAMAVILQSAVFGQQHFYYQGWAGALATGGIALVSGVFYLLLKRNLWALILSHGAANTIGLTLIYAGMQPAG